MSTTVCLFAGALSFPKGGGHLWVYLNWALGLRAIGCQVIWLEAVAAKIPEHEVQTRVGLLRTHLEPYDLADSVVLCSRTGEPLSLPALENCIDLDAAFEADLLLNLAYGIPLNMIVRFRRSALVDIDPGLTQIWISEGQMNVPRHDVYFTIGETVGQPGALFPDCGLRWHYTPPAVFLPEWPTSRANSMAPYTTVTNWWGGSNGKRDGFLPFLDLPRHTTVPLELAIGGAGRDKDCEMVQARGWRVRDAFEVASSPWDYQRYVQDSRGEFSCAKPSCIHLQNAWVSDRTLCFLASGKPAVVQHTGPSRFLPDSAGLFRFRDLQEAAWCLEVATADYDRQCRLGRALAEEYFDAQKVVGRVLERALA